MTFMNEWKSKWKIYDRFGSVYIWFWKIVARRTKLNALKKLTNVETKMNLSYSTCCVMMGEKMNFVINGMSFSHRMMTLIVSCIRHFVWHIFLSETLSTVVHRRKIKLLNGTFRFRSFVKCAISEDHSLSFMVVLRKILNKYSIN